MPDLPVTSPVDTFMQSADQAAMRAAMGLGTTDSPTSLTVTATTLGVGGGSGSYLLGAGANAIFQRNGTNAQSFYLANTYTDGTNYERGFLRYIGNILQLGHEFMGSGIARTFELVLGGTARFSVATNGAITTTNNLTLGGALTVNATSAVLWTGRSRINSNADGFLTFYNSGSNDFSTLQFGGTTSSFPALKRSTTTLQARLADDSAFAALQGKLTTETAYTAGAPTATGYITIYDATGTAYKVPASL